MMESPQPVVALLGLIQQQDHTHHGENHQDADTDRKKTNLLLVRGRAALVGHESTLCLLAEIASGF